MSRRERDHNRVYRPNCLKTEVLPVSHTTKNKPKQATRDPQVVRQTGDDNVSEEEEKENIPHHDDDVQKTSERDKQSLPDQKGRAFGEMSSSQNQNDEGIFFIASPTKKDTTSNLWKTRPDQSGERRERLRPANNRRQTNNQREPQDPETRDIYILKSFKQILIIYILDEPRGDDDDLDDTEDQTQPTR